MRIYRAFAEFGKEKKKIKYIGNIATDSGTAKRESRAKKVASHYGNIHEIVKNTCTEQHQQPIKST